MVDREHGLEMLDISAFLMEMFAHMSRVVVRDLSWLLWM